MLVYLITCLPTGEQYVGIVYGRKQTVANRWKEHCRSAKEGRRLHAAISQHGPGAFVIVVIDKAGSLEELYEKERQYIKQYNTYHNGLNGNIGGNYFPAERTADTRFKMGKAMRGKKHSQATRDKISRACTKGVWPKTKRAIRKAKVFTDAERAILKDWLRAVTLFG